MTADSLDREVQTELKGLGRGLALEVGAHLAAVAFFIDDDPDRAWAHAVAARRMAARLGVVRETAGLAAYRAGRFSDALAELRTARRMTGSNEHLPVMADSERGMGRPERALDLVRSPEARSLDRAGRIELAIVESGARADLGQLDAAVVAVRLPELEAKDSPTVARLRFAYAEALRAVGQADEAVTWHRRALLADRDGSAGIPASIEGDDYEDGYRDDLGEDEILDLEFDEDESELDAQEDAVDDGLASEENLTEDDGEDQDDAVQIADGDTNPDDDAIQNSDDEDLDDDLDDDLNDDSVHDDRNEDHSLNHDSAPDEAPTPALAIDDDHPFSNASGAVDSGSGTGPRPPVSQPVFKSEPGED